MAPFGPKHGVVAKSALTLGLGKYLTFHSTLKGQFTAVEYQRDDCDKACGAVCDALHIVKQQTHVCHTVVARAGIAGRIDTRRAAKRIDHKPRIISKAVIAVMLLDIASLLKSVACKSIGRLGDVVMTSDVRQRQYVKSLPDDATQLGEFMLIVGGKYYFLHRVLDNALIDITFL